MMTPAVLCATAEIALNRYLRLESSAVEECAQLSGKLIQVQLPSQQLALVIEFIPSGVRVLPEAPTPADVSVVATPSEMLAALRASSEGSLPTGLDVSGDVELLQRFRNLIARVGFDPEEWLAPMLGGVAAHRVAGGLKQFFGWAQTNSGRMADHTAEYLREESYDLARGRDVSQWMNEVDALRDATDRLEARLRQLESRSSPEETI